MRQITHVNGQTSEDRQQVLECIRHGQCGVMCRYELR